MQCTAHAEFPWQLLDCIQMLIEPEAHACTLSSLQGLLLNPNITSRLYRVKQDSRVCLIVTSCRRLFGALNARELWLGRIRTGSPINWIMSNPKCWWRVTASGARIILLQAHIHSVIHFIRVLNDEINIFHAARHRLFVFRSIQSP